MITTSNLPDMPCLLCKKDFHPRVPFLSKKPPITFYFCNECLDNNDHNYLINILEEFDNYRTME